MHIISKFSSPNFDVRKRDIRYIILHYTEMPFDEALAKLCDIESGVSCHYLIHDNGDSYNLVPDEKRAWHAGESYWRGEKGINHSSIGIELDNMGTDYFNKKQMTSCIRLCHDLMEKYDIPAENVLGHSDVAPSRKLDPGIFFDWEHLAENGIGIWPKKKEADIDLNTGHASEIDIKSTQEKLHRIGYGIKATGIHDQQNNFVIRAFQSRFLPGKILARGIDYYSDDQSIYEIDQHTYQMIDNVLAQTRG